MASPVTGVIGAWRRRESRPSGAASASDDAEPDDTGFSRSGSCGATGPGSSDFAEALARFGALEDVEVELAADEGAESVAAYRAQWAGHDGGRWAEGAKAVARLESCGERAQSQGRCPASC